MTDSQRLLAEYAKNSSESAFRELVTRYINFVYSAALRMVSGDRQLAEDVTQLVFINLAKKGRTLSHEVMLGGWLHQNTHYVANNVMRAERRRQLREREAMEMNRLQSNSDLQQVAPILDEAITQLGNADRTAILLRFFEQRDFRSVGEAMGSTEDAARMRVSRALEKLRSLLKHRGATLSVAALGTMLAAESVTAAPAGLAVAVSNIALAGTAGAGTTLTVLKLMANTKLKLGLATLVIAGAATTLISQHQSQAKLREENQSFRRQITQLKAENENLAALVAQADPTNKPGVSNDQLAELLRLRGDVGRLQQQTEELSRLRRENQNLVSQLAAQSESDPTNQISSEDRAILRQTHAVDAMNVLLTAFQRYTTNNPGQYPESLDQLAASANLDGMIFNGNLLLSDFEMMTNGARDNDGYKLIFSLKTPIPRTGLPSISILGEINTNGLPVTKIINVSE